LILNPTPTKCSPRVPSKSKKLRGRKALSDAGSTTPLTSDPDAAKRRTTLSATNVRRAEELLRSPEGVAMLDAEATKTGLVG
jgi:hypothetical protein